MKTLLKFLLGLTGIAIICIALTIFGAFMIDVVVRELLEIMPWK